MDGFDSMFDMNRDGELDLGERALQMEFLDRAAAGDGDMCGLCTVFRGKDPELAYRDYIEGNRSFDEVSAYYR